MHQTYLHQALHLAQQRRGFCAPNPAVGAVVVKEGRVLAEGFHQAAGMPHAEVEALKNLSQEASQGATIYVTLEPCAHQGKTPPCTDLLIQRGIKAVYYGMQDPNPLVKGKGHTQLAHAGVACTHMPSAEIEAFYQSYQYWILHQRPWVTLKLACSLDGKIAGPQGEPLAITGELARIFTHQRRKESDAILTTAKTLLQDDPQLNVRLENETYKKRVYVLDTDLSLSAHLRIYETCESLTVFYANDVELGSRLRGNDGSGGGGGNDHSGKGKHDGLENDERDTLRESVELPGKQSKIRYIAVSREYGKLSLIQILDHIGQDGMHDLWVEAGGMCFSSFLQQNLAQRAYIYVAPKWLGSAAKTAFTDVMVDVFERAKGVEWEAVGRDVLCKIGF